MGTSLDPRLDPLNNLSPTWETRALAWTLEFMSTLRTRANFVNAAIALGFTAGGVALAYLPLSPWYLPITAPSLLIGSAWLFGAIAKTLKRKPKRRRRR
jgi:hypothetical protein